MPTEVSISLPDVPEGENPFSVFYWSIRGLLNPSPTAGFRTRLFVLFALAGYGLVLSMVYLVTLGLEYRRRKRRFWLWRLVTRPNGRYIVGNQHVIFALCAFISCPILIGYFNNTRRVVLLLKFQQRAFFWRTLVWIPLILHAWLSSWANLQAAILSSQKATNQHLLSPIVANTVYVAGIIVVLVPIAVLDALSGSAWRMVWMRALDLKAVLLLNRDSWTDMSAEAAAQVIEPSLQRVNDELQFFGKMQRATSALYVLGMLVIIAVNLGGLGLLFTLRKQIKFNTRRLSGQMRSNTMPGAPSTLPPITPPGGPATPATAYFPGSPSPPHPLSPVLEEDSPTRTPAPKTLIRQVFFATQNKSGDLPLEKDERMTVSQLKDAASNKTPAASAQREQAKQLLALKKIEWDLFVFLAAIVVLATVFGALALWLCIMPSSVWSSWQKMETAFFLLPWMYLVGVDAALTFLFYNSCRHLLSSKYRLRTSRLTSVVGLGGRHANRHSITGLTLSDELTDGSFSRSMPAPPPSGVMVERNVVVRMDEAETGEEISPTATPRQ
ncbi:hypothetical protein JCM10207_001645 [Rhodosporidiobolus poonsookiae]